MTLAEPRIEPPRPARETSPWRGHVHARGPAPRRGDGPSEAAARQQDPAPPVDRPRLAEDVTLIGEFAGSGYRQPHHLARRPNGALVQLTHLLHLVAAASDGQRSLEDIAAEVSRAYGKTVSSDNVATLVDRLRPLGILADRDGRSPHVEPPDPLLALKLRTTLLSEDVTPRVARLLYPLFWPVVVGAAGVALVAFDVWLFFVHGLSESLRATAQRPLVFLLVASLVVVSAALHELGHAAACSYGGGRPGRMGAGVYVAWPAFYTDVTDAYSLDRRGRLRTDLGGVYLNALVVLALAGFFLATGFAPLLLVCFLLQVQIVQQLLPLLRLDGYYVLSDAVGVPDLHKRIGPIMRSLLPWRRTEDAVRELRTRVRVVVTAWVLVVVPLLLLNAGFMVLSAPRIIATGWDSAARLLGELTTAGDTAARIMAAVQLVFLVIPLVGVALMFVRLTRALLSRLRRWSAGSTTRQVLAGLAGVAVVAALAFLWWPDGRLTPYRQGERGTVQQSVAEVATAGTGRPLLRSPGEAQTALPPVPPGTSAVTGAAAGPPASTGQQPGEPAPDGGADAPATGAPGTAPGNGGTPAGSTASPGTSTPTGSPGSRPTGTAPPAARTSSPATTASSATTSAAPSSASAPPSASRLRTGDHRIRHGGVDDRRHHDALRALGDRRCPPPGTCSRTCGAAPSWPAPAAWC